MVAVDDTSVSNPPDNYEYLSGRLGRLRSVMHEPIIANGELVGFLTGSTVSRSRVWTAEDRLYALAISNLAALVVERHEWLQVEAAAKSRAGDLSRAVALAKRINGLLATLEREPAADQRPIKRA